MARNSLKNICRLINAVTQELPPEQQFLSDLKKSIELTDMKNRRPGTRAYKPSSMNCIRNMWYQVSGVEPEESVNSYCSVGICNSGTDIHVRVQTAVEDMKNNGFDCEYLDVADFVKYRGLDYLEIIEKSGMETKLWHKDLNMRFMCDGIIRYKNHYYILELKTETSGKWIHRTGVDPSHYNQATAYSISFNLPEVIFVYISRDTLDMKAYLYVPTDEEKNNLVGLITECDMYVNSGVCPPRPVDVSRKSCRYCAFQTRCNEEA